MDTARDTAERSALFRRNAARGRWIVTLQGSLLQAQQTGVKTVEVERRPRNPCSPFSPASRRRLLFRLARVDWSACRYAKFITLTYPSEYYDREFRRRTIDRDLFHRYIESYVGKHTANFWRTEWQVRKSGYAKGKLYPHLHMIVCTPRFLPHETVRDWWRSAIGWRDYIRTEVKLAGKVKNVAHYAAKYLSLPDDVSLVYASYLSSTPGRPWGIKRPSLLPLAPCRAVEDVPVEVVCRLREIAARCYKPIGERCEGGFTLLRDDVGKLFDRVEESVWTNDLSGL